MTIIFTRKFSQFVPQPVQSVVGLTGGANSIGPNSGGGAGVTTTITQANGFVPGQWLRVDDTGTYQLAEANDAQDGEAVGVVIAATPTEFTLQQAGYITPGQNVFNAYLPLGIGQVYFLNPAVPGGMIAQDATQNGQITRPLFLPDTTGGGWVLPYRPLIVGGEAPVGPNTDANFVTITQAGNTFVVGDWIRVDTDDATGPVSYTLAEATTLANAQCVGVVVEILVAGSQFVLQFSGYNIGSVTQDDQFAPIVSSNVYYLSGTRAGYITSIDPGLTGLISKPLYISEQTTMFPQGLDNGYILPQRPLPESFPNPNVILITQPGHGLTAGQIVRLNGSIDYVPAQANTLANSQAVGVVINVIPGTPSNQFILQTEGYYTNSPGANTGPFSVDDGGNPLLASTVYYLSTTVAGALNATNPLLNGLPSKPIYISEQIWNTTGTNAGYIEPQRPIQIPTGTIGTVLTSKGVGNAQTFSSYPLPFYQYGQGFYYAATDLGHSQGNSSTLATYNYTAGQMNLMMFFCHQTAMVSEIGFYLVTGVAASTACMAILPIDPVSFIALSLTGNISTPATASGTFISYVYPTQFQLIGGKFYWVCFQGTSSLLQTSGIASGQDLQTGFGSGNIFLPGLLPALTNNHTIGAYAPYAYDPTFSTIPSTGAFAPQSPGGVPLFYLSLG
jgi:hypothetical protein